MRLAGLLLILCYFCCSCGKNKAPLFEQLSAEKTGVVFNNKISENDTFNILTYEYIYNGGGVAIADFNQDGNQDLFFTGNQVENQLYLNRGNWKFENITAQAKVGGKERWKSGVAVTDLNYDGKMDIYVSCMTYNPGARRANLFYVNQGNDKNGVPTFKELASEYGIADTSYNTACAFLDYDNDGDQDLYLAVNHQKEDEFPNAFHPKSTDGSSYNHDILYRNDWDPVLKHAVFTDVSLPAGINGEGYGLAISITDINRDGWKDIYVSNDYLTNDHLYINNQDGTFTDRGTEYFKHTSYSAMGNEVVDFNNDGLMDIVALDMMPEDNYRRKTMLPANNYNTFQNYEEYKYLHQYVRNTLQINQGFAPGTQKPVFSEVSMLAGVSSTDWSWTPIAADFDLDGFRDLIVTNGFPKDVTDLDFVDYNSNSFAYASKGFLNDNIPSVKLKNYAFRNRGDLSFESMGEQWGITETSFSNGAAYGDLDNDGDLDYVVNNINDPASLFRNNLIRTGTPYVGAPTNNGRPRRDRPDGRPFWIGIKLKGDSLNPMGLGAFIEIQYGKNQKQYWEHSIYRGYLSSIQPLAHFGLGSNEVVSKIIVTWPNHKQQVLTKIKSNQVIEIDYRKAATQAIPPPPPPLQPFFANVTAEVGVNFLHEEADFIDFNLQPLLPHKLSQYGPGLAVADVNGDGLDDFFTSGGHFHKGRFFIQSQDGKFQEEDLLDGVEGLDKKGEDLGILFFDADNDGDQDLYLVRGGVEFPADNPAYQDNLYLNDKGKFSPAKAALPAFLKSGSCIKAADFDRDGDLDLFIGGRTKHREYPLPVSSYLLRNESKAGHPKFVLANTQIAPELNDLGLVCDALWTDYDQDGWVDLLLAGEWMPLTILKNQKGKLSNVTAGSGLEKYTGWWSSLTGADFDGDGDVDYLAGNLGLNTLYKASEKYPIGIYAADFDGNKGYDAIPAVFFPNRKGELEEFPYNGRLDLDKQVILSKRKYLLHAEFAQVNMQDYLKNFENIKPLHLRANWMQSSLIRNLGNGKFAVEALPTEAQFAPIYGMATGDWNDDGHLDALCLGNDFGSEVTSGRYDAFNGLLLLGDGKGKLKPCLLPQSGFYVPGDAKSLIQLSNAKGEQLFVAGQNRGPLLVFKQAGPILRSIPYGQNDAFVQLKLGNGKTKRCELYQGNGFLSQSSRKIFLPSGAIEASITDFTGKSRLVKL
ncbi:VCBS repeat-containing protein [Haliscomenobacter sp.]|uniref:VCBS repeat-containing protein n=1 Tax=Haliscomenobacter sp. TaxID=2717303 RepID=UPI0033651EC8